MHNPYTCINITMIVRMNILLMFAQLVALMTFPISLEAQEAYYQREDSVRFAEVMKSAGIEQRDVLFFASHFIGSPYVAHTLEVHDPEQVVVNLREFDCTTFVESALSMYLCHRGSKTAFSDYIDMLEMIRYTKGKNTGYPSRLHYFSQWIDDNTSCGIVQEITPQCSVTNTQILNLSYMSAYPYKYKILRSNPSFVAEIRAEELKWKGHRVRYIPKSEIYKSKSQLSCIDDGDIIVFVAARKGLDTTHLGFAKWHNDGKLHLINASSLRGRVVDESKNLYDYLKNNSSVIGIRVVKVL